MHRRRSSPIPFDAWPLVAIALGMLTLFLWPPKS